MKNGRYEYKGNVHWYKDNVRHRLDGPAIEWENGSKEWHVNGICHRLDGPAFEDSHGYKEWWVDGQEVDIIAVFGYEPSIPLSEEEQLILRLSV